MKDVLASIVIGLGSATGVKVASEVGLLNPVNHATISMFGADIYALSMSIVGALLAMGVASPITPRSKMWLFFVISAIAGVTTASLLPFAPVIGDSLTKAPMAPVAFVMSFMSRWAIPVVIEEVPKLIKRKINGEDQ